MNRRQRNASIPPARWETLISRSARMRVTDIWGLTYRIIFYGLTLRELREDVTCLGTALSRRGLHYSHIVKWEIIG